MRIHVCTVAFRRPLIYAETLRALAACDGINECRISHIIDPVGGACQEAVVGAVMESGIGGEVIVHPSRVGCTGNVERALRHGFGSDDVDAVIMVEDDCMPSRDFILYNRRCLELFGNNERVGTISSFNMRKSVGFEGPAKFQRGEGDPLGIIGVKGKFSPWGWSITRRFWKEHVEQQWSKRITPARISWDIALQGAICGNLILIRPDMSRIQNTGNRNGTYCHNANWHRTFVHNEVWMGDGVEREDLTVKGADLRAVMGATPADPVYTGGWPTISGLEVQEMIAAGRA